jgi:hypothetical protein
LHFLHGITVAGVVNGGWTPIWRKFVTVACQPHPTAARLSSLERRELELAQSGSRFTTRLRTLREGDEGTEGKAVSFETGSHPKTGKIKAISVDLN